LTLRWQGRSTQRAFITPRCGRAGVGRFFAARRVDRFDLDLFRGARASYPGGDPDDVLEGLDGIELLPPEAGSFRLLAVSASQAQLSLHQDTALPEKSRLVVASALRCLQAAAVTTSKNLDEAMKSLPEAIESGVSTTLLTAWKS
jgi:hypothetical protein